LCDDNEGLGHLGKFVFSALTASSQLSGLVRSSGDFGGDPRGTGAPVVPTDTRRAATQDKKKANTSFDIGLSLEHQAA
jgi:hypothetical protein